MRLHEQEPIDPEIAATLDAIDATLAGEPVDGRYAELAEVALLLASDRPQAPPEFGRSMDERVARRFAPAPAPGKPGPGRRRNLSRFWEATAALAAGVALILAIVVVAGHSGGSSGASSFSGIESSSSSAGSSATALPQSSAGHAPQRLRSASTASTAAAAPSAPAAAGSAAPTLTPPTTGRKVVQSAQLSLSAAPNRIDAVAQQVYNVVGALNGIVESSTVTQTGGADGYADFQLSVPSGSLGQAMSRLSALTYAQVVSRTDNTQDITDQYNSVTRSLADARALRTSLLKQLENAATTEQINSIRAQINDAEASISSDLATLGRLNHQVDFSQLSVEVNARSVPPPVSHGSGGFGIGRAAHDAGRVLTVAAAGALIALAGLTPVALLAALAWWVGAAVRRRRRDQALDSV
jgi:hypothetical protein